MKYCIECGKKLQQPNPKHCPECGAAISGDEAKLMDQKSKDKKTLTFAGFLRLIGIGVLALLLIIAMALYPSTQWEWAKNAGEKFYQDYTIFSNDVNDLKALKNQYVSLPLTNETFGQKGNIAKNYASKAKEAVVTWDYFDSFMRQNEGRLGQWNVSVKSPETEIANAKSDIHATAMSMETELERYAGMNQTRMIAISGTLKSLKELEQ